MSEENLEKEITKLEKYLLRQGRQDFLVDMKKSTKEEREAKLLSLTQHKQELLTTMANDDELNSLKEKVKFARSVYTDQTKMNDKLSRFIHLLMKDEGEG